MHHSSLYGRLKRQCGEALLSHHVAQNVAVFVILSCICVSLLVQESESIDAVVSSSGRQSVDASSVVQGGKW